MASKGDNMAQISGHIIVDESGTPKPLGVLRIDGPLVVKALDANSGLIYLGNDGTGGVSSSTGMQLAAGEAVVFDWVGSLSSLQVDAAVSGEGAAWLALDV
jgi:hypothetical protein